MNESRDVELDATPLSGARAGRRVLVSIGIDRYRHWRRLANAVNDANGARALFQQLGFQDAVRPLLDETATGAALHALVTDELGTLGPNDSLILFYAGHGGARTLDRSGRKIKRGYIIPVDAEQDRASTWLDLESWLRHIALLPPRHILVILDACHSGIALDPIVRWRSDDDAAEPAASRDTLDARCSRRIITSALDDERALDCGPVRGHSLFTGYLIEALRGGVGGGSSMTTGAELGVWIRERVRRYANARQTPDFGTFELHDHGEMLIPLVPRQAAAGTASPNPVIEPKPPLPQVAHPHTSHPPWWSAFGARLQRDAEWLAVGAPLLGVAALAAISRAC